MKLSRKQFLLLGGGGSLVLLGAPLAVYLRELFLDGAVSPESRARLGAFFQEHPAAIELGRHYLEENPDAGGEARLARRILEKLEIEEPAAADELAAALRRAQIRDWDRGEPRLVRGWFLTELEVLLCALASMLSTQAI